MLSNPPAACAGRGPLFPGFGREAGPCNPSSVGHPPSQPGGPSRCPSGGGHHHPFASFPGSVRREQTQRKPASSRLQGSGLEDRERALLVVVDPLRTGTTRCLGHGHADIAAQARSPGRGRGRGVPPPGCRPSSGVVVSPHSHPISSTPPIGCGKPSTEARVVVPSLGTAGCPTTTETGRV